MNMLANSKIAPFELIMEQHSESSYLLHIWKCSTFSETQGMKKC